MCKTKYAVAIDVVDSVGMLVRILNQYTRKGYNIESVSARKVAYSNISRVTVFVTGDKEGLERINKQLFKIIGVVSVTPINLGENVERELVFAKIKAKKENLNDFFRLVKIFKGSIVDASNNELIVELTGEGEKIDAFLNLVGKKSLVEVSRTGVLAMNRCSVEKADKFSVAVRQYR